jgi:hypothetical protein
MQVYIFNPGRQLVGVIESFEYLRWTRKYSEPGNFEMKAVADSRNAAVLQIGGYIWKSDDQEIGMIERLVMEQTTAEIITISGRFSTALLAKRIIWGTEVLNGDIASCITQLINNHLISPTDSNRAIPYITFSASDTGVAANFQVSYHNLLLTVTELLEAADIGIRTVFDPVTGLMGMTLYQGGISQAVFARAYENILSQIYTRSVKDSADTALIAGEGEGSERQTVVIGGNTSSDLRSEIYVDARDLQSETIGTGSVYTDALLYRGQQKLSEVAPINSLDAEINSHGNLNYKSDFDLGQIVTVKSPNWGITLQTRITEIQETYDMNGRSLDITFGRGLVSLGKKIKGEQIYV